MYSLYVNNDYREPPGIPFNKDSPEPLGIPFNKDSPELTLIKILQHILTFFSWVIKFILPFNVMVPHISYSTDSTNDKLGVLMCM